MESFRKAISLKRCPTFRISQLLLRVLVSFVTLLKFYDYALSKFYRIYWAMFPNTRIYIVDMNDSPAYVSNRNSGHVWWDGKTVNSRNQTNRNPTPRGVGVFIRARNISTVRRDAARSLSSSLFSRFTTQRRTPRGGPSYAILLSTISAWKITSWYVGNPMTIPARGN